GEPRDFALDGVRGVVVGLEIARVACDEIPALTCAGVLHRGIDVVEGFERGVGAGNLGGIPVQLARVVVVKARVNEQQAHNQAAADEKSLVEGTFHLRILSAGARGLELPGPARRPARLLQWCSMVSITTTRISTFWCEALERRLSCAFAKSIAA